MTTELTQCPDCGKPSNNGRTCRLCDSEDAMNKALTQRPAAQTEQQPVASAPVADERAAKLDAECNSLAHQLNASNERNGMLRAALSDCSAELFAQCGDQSRAMSYVNAARAALAQNAPMAATPEALIVKGAMAGMVDAQVRDLWPTKGASLPAPQQATPADMQVYDGMAARYFADTQQATPEPVGEVVYQLQSGDGKWIDQTRASYDYNVKHGNTVRVLYTRPAPGVPDVEDLRDRLVAISAAVAHSDDRAAQSMLSETLRLLAAAQAKGE